ncbi:right-handed parallel beta-helix repeat-containing protein [Singulisphaera sp. Ch08]|uniref:Right-handed parallel beta-helix repeat-containing protein n=1 Tax=Singulisphaera sp. Ch08 TaxID=3120278 RepID=A0AAU7CL33_9BACT
MTNVRDFGAVGDGRADDTKALRHAVEQGGGQLDFPRGTYRLTAPLEIDLDRSGPIALSGQGGTARLLMDGPGPAVRLVGTHGKSADPTSFEPRVWQHQRMPTVSGLEIVGNHDQADGIEIEAVMQPTISGVLIRRCRYGVHLVKRNRNVLLADLHIYDGRGPAIGVYFDGVNVHQAIVTGCHISYCKHAGIKIARSEIRNIQITGCDIEYNFDTGNPESADVWIDAREATVREGTIASNTIQAKGSPKGANIRIEGAERDDSGGAGLWNITGNVLQDQQVNVWLRYCRGITLTGNTFASAYERSLVLEHCRDIVVGSNVFDNNPDYKGPHINGIRVIKSAGINLQNLILDGARAGSTDEGGAIEVVDSNEVLILGCQVLDPEFRGVDIRNCRNTKVSECNIIDRRARPTMREPVRIVDAHGKAVSTRENPPR